MTNNDFLTRLDHLREHTEKLRESIDMLEYAIECIENEIDKENDAK